MNGADLSAPCVPRDLNSFRKGTRDFEFNTLRPQLSVRCRGAPPDSSFERIQTAPVPPAKTKGFSPMSSAGSSSSNLMAAVASGLILEADPDRAQFTGVAKQVGYCTPA